VSQGRTGSGGHSQPAVYRSGCMVYAGLAMDRWRLPLNVMVPDLTRIASRHGGTLPADQVRRIIDGRAVQPPHGKRAMPVWGTDFRTAGASHVAGAASADELVGRLVEDVRSMRMKYSAGRSSCSVLRTKAIFVSVLVLDRSPSCQECSHACPMRGHIATNIHRR
jgi:hypothetical protein